MKKLITGAVATLVLLFGFASCSGDLHDNDVQPLTVTGLCGTAVVPMELVNADGSLQKLTFKVSEDTKLKSLDPKNPEYALKDGWGGLTDINFKIIPQSAIDANYEPTWAMDFGGPKDNDLYLSATKTDNYTQLKSRAEFSSGFPSNIHIDSAVANEEYTIWVKYDAAAVTCSVWLSGVSSNPTEMRLVATASKNFPAEDMAETPLVYAFEKAGQTYTYDFIAKETETIKFHLENDFAGTTFGGASVGFFGSSNNGWDSITLNDSADMSLAVTKDVEYKITFTLAKQTDGKVTYVEGGMNHAGIKAEVVSLTKKATINADWKYGNVFYETDKLEGKDYYYFKADRTSVDFTVNRIAEDASMIWGGKTTSTSIKVGDDAVTLKYVTDVVKTTVETVNNKKVLKQEVITSAAKTVKNVKLTNLTVGNWYKIVFELKNDEPSISVKLENAAIPELTKQASYMWSNVNSSSWGQDTTKYPYKHGFPKFVANGSVENSYYADFSPVGTSVEFGIKYEWKEDGNDSGNASSWFGTGADIKELDKEETKNIITDTPNGKISNLTAGESYRLYATFLDPVTVVLKVVKR